MYKFIKLEKANDKKHKYEAIFLNEETNRKKTVKFGSYGMSDYTIHKDKDRKENYIKRHEKREDWENPLTAGALSRWILWNKESLSDSLSDYLKKFKDQIS